MDENTEEGEMIKEIAKRNNYKIKENLWKGGFGYVVEVIIWNNSYVGKLIKKKKGESIYEADFNFKF